MGVMLWLIVPVIALAVFAWTTRRIPAKVYAGTGFGLWLGNLWQFGWQQAGLSLAVALMFFALGIAVRLNRKTVFSLTAVAVGVPLTWFWLLVVGLAGAGLWSAWRLRSIHGAGFLPMMVGETMSSMGVPPGGSVAKPDLSRLPKPANPDAAPGLNLLRWCAVGAASGLLLSVGVQFVLGAQFGG